MNKIILCCALIIGAAISQENVLNLYQFNDQIPDLEYFNQSALPQKEKVEQVLREKCKKNGGENAFDDIINSRDNMLLCFEAQIYSINYEEKENKFKLAKTYCKKRPQFFSCLTDFTNKVDKCLEAKEKDNLKIVVNVTKSLADIICFNDGYRLAKFVTKGGFECLQERSKALQACANEILGKRIPADLSMANLPSLSIHDCGDLVKLQECAVNELKKCKDNTPANIVEDMFKYIEGMAPCKKIKTESKPLVFRAAISQENGLNFDQFKDKIPDLEDFNQSALSQNEEEDEILREKCQKNGGENAFDDIINSRDYIEPCLDAQFNLIEEELENEIYVAKKKGSMDMVLKKYCKKQILSCLTDFTNNVDKCLKAKEKDNLKIVVNVTKSLADFICFKDGYKLIKFWAEGDFECLQERTEALQACANEILDKRFPANLSTSILSLLSIDICGNMLKLQECVVKELEKCQDNTPAIIAKAIFKNIEGVTPCKDVKPESKPLVFRAAISQENDINVDQFKYQIPDLEDFNPIAMPRKIEEDEVGQVLREKCNKNGGENVFDDINISRDNFQLCFEAQMYSTEEEQNDLEVAYITGSMDSILKTYCKKHPQIFSCFTDFTNKVDTCLEAKEKDNLKIVVNATKSLADFICFKDGYRLDMFEAEGGFKCLQERSEALQACANKILYKRIPADLSMGNLPSLSIHDCGDLVKLQECAVNELKKCKDNTPANIVEDMFKYIEGMAPCKKIKPESKPLVFRAAISQENGLNFDQFKDKIPDLEDINQSALSQNEEEDEILREKCQKNGGENAFDDIINSRDYIEPCLDAQFNLIEEELENEIYVAKKKGSMDMVLKKYCKKRPQILSCLTDFTNNVDKCLKAKEKDNLKIVVNVTKSLADFICFKDGYKLIKFWAEGDFECLQERTEALQACANEILDKRFPANLSTSILSLLSIDICGNMLKLQECAVKELEKCQDNTPAIIAKAIFKNIEGVTPCKDVKPESKPLVFRAAISQENDINVDQFKYQIPDLEDFTPIAMPRKIEEDEVGQVLREKCNKNGGENVFDDINISRDNFQLCFEAQMYSTEEEQNDLEVAYITGSMDSILKTYCKKHPQIFSCFTDFTNKVDTCLEAKEKDNLKIVVNATKSLADFICFKDGYRLDMFEAVGGFKCLQERSEALQACANKILYKRIPADLSMGNLPLLTIDVCGDMLKLQECAVKELEKCKDSTPANIVKNIFKYIKELTPCKQIKPESKPLVFRAAISQENGLNFDQFKYHIPDLEDLNQSALPQKEEEDEVLREKCQKNGGEYAFDDVINSRDNFQPCLDAQINLIEEELENEIYVAKKTGSMDKVLRKYCKKRPQFLSCLTEFTNNVDKCLEAEEKDNFKIVVNVTKSLANFICFKDGYRLVRFEADGGFKCLQERSEALQACANKILYKRIPADSSMANLPFLTINICEDIPKLQECAVKEFEKCKDNTTANIVEAMFKYIKEVTPCKNESSSSIKVASFILIISAIFIKFM